MKVRNIYIAFIYFAIILIAGCSKTGNGVVNPPQDNNLLTNGSFEADSSGSLQGWQIFYEDTAYVNFSKDVPPYGGSFSVRLLNNWSFAGYISQSIVPQEGSRVYQLSASAKLVDPGFFENWGTMRISVHRYGTEESNKSLNISDTSWISVSILDTLDIYPGDTLTVYLSGNKGQFTQGYILFDLVKLEKVE